MQTIYATLCWQSMPNGTDGLNFLYCETPFHELTEFIEVELISDSIECWEARNGIHRYITFWGFF